MTGSMRARMMPKVMATEISADATSTTLMTRSPGRDLALRSTAGGRPVPKDEPAPLLELLLM